MKIDKTYIIQNISTKEQWTAQSGKSSWKQENHAKCAFANSNNKRDPLLKDYCANLGKYDSLKFKDQDIYEVVELKAEDTLKLEEIRDILKEMKQTFLYTGNGKSVVDIIEGLL